MRLIDADALKFRDVKVTTNEIDLFGFGGYYVAERKGILQEEILDAPTVNAVPVQHEDDGTLWVTVGDCEKVGRVIVKNEREHFCRVFYMGDGDEEPVRHGRWESFEDVFLDTCYECSECGLAFYLADGGTPQENQYNYCPNCGARMDGESDDE